MSTIDVLVELISVKRTPITDPSRYHPVMSVSLVDRDKERRTLSISPSLPEWNRRADSTSIRTMRLPERSDRLRSRQSILINMCCGRIVLLELSSSLVFAGDLKTHERPAKFVTGLSTSRFGLSVRECV